MAPFQEIDNRNEILPEIDKTVKVASIIKLIYDKLLLLEFQPSALLFK